MKYISKAYFVLGILFIIFNVLAFIVPATKTSVFWIAYIFSVIAFAVQLGVFHFTLKDTCSMKNKFLGIPTIYIGILYLIIQLISFVTFTAVPKIPLWIAVIICIVTLGVFLLCLLGAETSKKEISTVEEKVQSKIFYLRSLQAEIEVIAEQETDKEIKAKLTELAEKIRFADPISNDGLAELEANISQRVNMMNTSENKFELIEEIYSLLNERDKKIKFLK